MADVVSVVTGAGAAVIAPCALVLLRFSSVDCVVLDPLLNHFVAILMLHP